MCIAALHRMGDCYQTDRSESFQPNNGMQFELTFTPHLSTIIILTVVYVIFSHRTKNLFDFRLSLVSRFSSTGGDPALREQEYRFAHSTAQLSVLGMCILFFNIFFIFIHNSLFMFLVFLWASCSEYPVICKSG